MKMTKRPIRLKLKPSSNWNLPSGLNRSRRKQSDKEKQKGFATIQKLPSALHDSELAKLAKCLGEKDETALCQEFQEFLGITEGTLLSADVEPWPEPVNLSNCSTKSRIRLPSTRWYGRSSSGRQSCCLRRRLGRTTPSPSTRPFWS